MKAELRKQLMTKLDAIYMRSVALVAHGAEFQGKKDERWKETVEKTWKRHPFRKKYEAVLCVLPDDEFEAESKRLDSGPQELRRKLLQNLPALPKSRGGRPPNFPLDVRHRAIGDVAHELRNNSFADAVGLVAARHKMPEDYLRKIWKNRKRLNQR